MFLLDPLLLFYTYALAFYRDNNKKKKELRQERVSLGASEPRPENVGLKLKIN